MGHEALPEHETSLRIGEGNGRSGLISIPGTNYFCEKPLTLPTS